MTQEITFKVCLMHGIIEYNIQKLKSSEQQYEEKIGKVSLVGVWI